MFPVDADGLVADSRRLFADARARAQEAWSPSPVESWKDDLVVTVDAIRNFRRNWISGGTINAPDRPLKFPAILRATNYEAEPARDRILGQARLIRTLAKMIPYLPSGAFQTFSALAQDDGFGAARRTYLPGLGHVSDASIRYALYAVRLYPLTGFGQAFFEVGGGFGGLCQQLFPYLRAQRYLLTDLPINMILSYYNLASHFGEMVGRFWFAEDRSQIERPILIVAPWLLPLLQEKLDIAVNTVSFQHMSYANLKYYGEVFELFGIRRIFHANRDVRRDPTDVMVDDYPFRKNYGVSVRRKSWLHPTVIEEFLIRKEG